MDRLDERVRGGRSPIHGTGCFARAPFAPGDHIGTFTGPETTLDGSHVLWAQVEHRDGSSAWVGRLGTSPLRFLNHADTPNAAFAGFELSAVRSIAPGDEITIDYQPDA